MAVDWSYFDKFEWADEKYLPARGEGDTMASQIVTAVTKLVYKWYNDGDVFDNTGHLTGWCNDLSSYANWLVRYTDRAGCLYSIFDIKTDGEYEDLLKELVDATHDESYLEEMNLKSKDGSIYDCDGPFRFEEEEYEEEEDYEDESYDEEEDF